MAPSIETGGGTGPADVGLRRTAGRAVGVLLQQAPTVIGVIILLHGYLAVDGICAVIRAPWCEPVPDNGTWFGTPSFHLYVALTSMVASAAWGVGAAVLLPRLAASWPDGQRSDAASPAFSPAALGRCLAVALLLAAVRSLASAPSWYLSIRDGGFGPSSPYWGFLSTVEGLYRLASSVALAPFTYLSIVAIVDDGLPIVPAFVRAWAAITGWPSSVAVPLWLLELLNPGTLLDILFLTVPMRLVAPVLMAYPAANWLVRFGDAVAVVFMLALALGLWRDVRGEATEATE